MEQGLSPKEQKRREWSRAALRQLRPIDDTLMRLLFKDQLELAQQVLRIITGIDDLVLLGEETQKDLHRLVGARSVCLDVYGEDSQGRRYDPEVQRATSGAQPRRARYLWPGKGRVPLRAHRLRDRPCVG